MISRVSENKFEAQFDYFGREVDCIFSLNKDGSIILLNGFYSKELTTAFSGKKYIVSDGYSFSDEGIKRIIGELTNFETSEVYCFTFGQNHTHPLGGYPMKNYWIEVHGSYSTSRQKMVNKFGNKWSMQYLKSDFDPFYFPGGCHEIIK
jgi:hypothetical protein